MDTGSLVRRSYTQTFRTAPLGISLTHAAADAGATVAVRAVSRAFEETFDHLVEYGLRRDQNVFPVSLLHEQLQFAAGSMLCGPADGVLLYARRLPR